MSDEPESERTMPETPVAKVKLERSKSGAFYFEAPAADDAVLRHEIKALIQRMTAAEERSDRLAAEIRELRARAPAARLETVCLDGGDPRVER